MLANHAFRLSFRDDIKLVEAQTASAALIGREIHIPLRQLSAGWQLVLTQLGMGGGTEQDLGKLLLDRDGEAALFQFYPRMQQLIQKGIICHTLSIDQQRFATITPASSAYRFQAEPIDPHQCWLLSRFAYCHREQGELVIDSPQAAAKLVLHDPNAAVLLALLAQPHTLAELAPLAKGLAPDMIGLFLGMLHSIKALVAVDAAGHNDEEHSPTLGQWEFHDLLFHTRSRMGRHAGPYGGTFPSKGKFTQLPVVKDPPSAEMIALELPDLDRLYETDPPLTAVIERRRSIRSHGEIPITRQQLGEFLYRVARVKKVVAGDAQSYGISFRPYPAGGALYELEIYPVVNRCAGLDAGLYCYQPLDHALSKIASRTPQVDLLLEMAASAAMSMQPQIFFGITARFQRVQWKYQGMAYALMLKHVGVLYQTMYLVATAMGLAPCALGGGNADVFSKAADLDYYAETMIGEFVLGTIGHEQPEFAYH
jgi:SagB-type dehydrogenase family enzyme